MGEHYFTENPEVEHDRRDIEGNLLGKNYTFTTDAGVFSKTRIDRGSELLVEAMKFDPDAKVLEIGCGYGPMGIAAADMAYNGQVTMVDINQRAVDLTKENLRRNSINNAQAFVSNGFENVEDQDYDVILMNPPIRAGKKVIYPLVEETVKHLKKGGVFYTVCMTRQGAKSLAKHMKTVFPVVEEVKKGSGYRVYRAIKK